MADVDGSVYPLDSPYSSPRPGSVYDGALYAFLVEPPPLYYRMRGIDQTCPAIQQPAYVYWTVQDEPDWLAALLSPSDLPCGSTPSTDVVDIQISGQWVEGQ